MTCPGGEQVTWHDGAAGPAGGEGPAGGAGPQGDPGPQGGAGEGVLVEVEEEPPGEACPEGGIRVRMGSDADGNGALDDAEVLDTAWVWTWTPTGSSARTR